MMTAVGIALARAHTRARRPVRNYLRATVMAHIVMTHIVIVHILMAHMLMAHIGKGPPTG